MRQLIADREDTEQVFRIVKALSGNSYYRNFNRFMKSSDGRRIASDRADLLET
jgi:ubiquinone biosynthesis protein COQ4